ncbi:MAG: ornithine cyclodeaminase family protein [Gemmatimonadetes bacterium]|nr:ornithine cyclodeaminase family protein [Gemmatimonadota bacterium]
MTTARTLIVSHDDVVRLLPMAACIDLMGETLGALTRGEGLLPLRTVLRLPGQRNMFATMPAVLGPSIGAKVITVFPDNEGTPYESHIGVVLYFESTNGRLLAIIDASSVTAIRTAAVSGLATRWLARPDARTLGILGSGVQAMTHLEAMCAVRDFSTIRVWSRHHPNALAFAERAAATLGRTVEVVPRAEDAVRGADVVCTTTGAREPVVRGEWLAPGAHLNAVGASVATARELDSEAVRRARLYVDRRESVMAEAGDFLIPREEGVVDNTHIVGELGELVLGRVPGRRSADEVTIFKSLGLAVEDVASARFIYERAEALGTGTWVALGGLR